MTSTFSLRTAPLAGSLALLLLLPASTAVGGSKTPDKDEPEKPRLTLRADPSFGFTPVMAMLTGELTGVDQSDPNFCHPAVTWFRLDPGDSEETASKLRHDPVCRHAEDESIAKTYFTKRFTLSRPGSYLFRLVIEGKNGRTMRSDYARVRVMRVR